MNTSNPISFKINFQNHTSLAVFVPAQDGATFLFDRPMQLTKKESSSKLVIENNAMVKNPVGFIISRMERLSLLNGIDSICINGDVHYLKDSVKILDGSREQMFVFGKEVSNDDTITVMITTSTDIVTSTATTRVIDLKQNNRDIKVQTIFVPIHNDENGFPRYCRNTTFNKILYGAKIGYDDNKLNHYLSLFSMYHKRLLHVASIFSDLGIDYISAMFIDRYIAFEDNKRWSQYTKKSDVPMLGKIIENYNTKIRATDNSQNFKTSDLFKISSNNK